jgi:hypothetical protein
MHRLIILLIALISFAGQAAEEKKLILTESSIGEMPIKVGMKISLYKIRNHFRYYRVTQEIAEGDSPDYNLFVVSTHEGEELISFISYINESDDYEEGVVKLDEVVIYGTKTQDEFGVTPGMHIKQAIAKRKELKFGAGHMDNYLGNGSVWYLFSVNQTHGTAVTEDMAVEANPKIDAISWPYPRWQ